YLPQYSPDLNPIEMPFSKLKASLRKAAERTIPRLRRRIGRFACNLTAREPCNYFRHAGYQAIRLESALRFTVALSMLAGAALGAAAIQGLHAQAKPKAYIITESEVLDAGALAAYIPKLRDVQKAHGARLIIPAGGKVVASVGEPPKRIGVTEYEGVEKA